MIQPIYFVSGIDTNVGKTIATGLLARSLTHNNINVITQKMIQTGCQGIAEDILQHRRLQGIELLPQDIDHTTCSCILPYPASPHLAARMHGIKIDTEQVARSSDRLLQHFDTILLEGAGGLMVPIDEQQTTIDYIARKRLPVILVTSGRLGSINHTLLSLEACKIRKIRVAALLYNHYPSTDPIIEKETESFLRYAINTDTSFINLPLYSESTPPMLDIDEFIQKETTILFDKFLPKE